MSTAEAAIVEVASADTGTGMSGARAVVGGIPHATILALIAALQLAWLGALVWGAVRLLS